MNTLFIMCDTLRADFLGCYGNDWIHTPNIDQLASEGVVFTGCYAEGQPTIQARRALMSGRRTFPWKDDRVIPGDRLNLQPGWQPLNDDDYTIAEILRDNGYWTGFITDVAQYFKPGMNFHRGFDTYDFVRGQSCDFYNSPVSMLSRVSESRLSASELRRSRGARYEAITQTFRSEEDYFAAQVYGKAAQWILEHRNAERIFLWADAFDPHEPWTPPDAYQDLYTKEELLSEPYALSQHPACQSEEAIAARRAAYAGEVTYLDRWVGYLLEALELSGRAHDTIVVFHSDHGTTIGHAGLPAKGGHAMYQCQSRNPLIIRHPEGLGAGKRIDALCYNCDVTPTLLELADIPIPEVMQAKSLAPLLRGEADSFRSCVTSGYNDWLMYRDQKYLVFQQFSGAGTVLIDLDADPREERNIADGNEELIIHLRQRLEAECGGLPVNPGWSWPPNEIYASEFPRVF